ncbi:MAG: CTP synthase (glutamine hydrolyzing) [Nanoarchaeota archaeon]|nr:CTP synthase (glutamine hydrolyzing) [Nanoarchaeota archaeon]MBU1321217.1 CTP synthase (glutamine hydrolyzing) [Nanoarchaeota archaeon]MBU1597022.1 CTP synthase (glutamine hydrolyzing) [Nanoarchaeota archaeon]MBU2441832.1 CTP synthase (glutamine hydrolyzing) [Nanoarchaeota archaeon]
MPVKNKTDRKFIVVTGGVLSGLGKGVAAASIGNLITKAGLKVIPIKCDGYLNVDPGTMNPVEHGEVFVLDDGGEVDMDFGHYERFLNVTCKFKWNLTMGKVYESIRKKERRGDYLGKTVQLIPHVSDLIKEWFFEIGKEENADVVMIEVGGTVGDIENELYIEACRQLKRNVGEENILYIHLTYIPIPGHVGEQKSKPTQQSVALLRERGIEPDVIIGRCSEYLDEKIKKKISTFCGVDEKAVITGIDVDSVYKLPLSFSKEGINDIIKKELGIESGVKPEWKKLVDNLSKLDKEVTVAICGKYTELDDSYASIVEALKHCSANLKVKVNVKMVETTDINSPADAKKLLKGISGVIVPGGFGSRGTEGKIKVIQYCRESNIPFLGICLGLQLAVAEFARNVCGLKGANSTELDSKTKHPVVDILPEQKNIKDKGGTMRLGAYPALIKPNTLIWELYGKQKEVSERHRHRYEVNPEYHDILLKNGLIFSGMSPDRKLVEFFELPKNKHKYFVGTQAHPELKSRFEKPAPLFYGLVKACLEK